MLQLVCFERTNFLNCGLWDDVSAGRPSKIHQVLLLHAAMIIIAGCWFVTYRLKNVKVKFKLVNHPKVGKSLASIPRDGPDLADLEMA